MSTPFKPSSKPLSGKAAARAQAERLFSPKETVATPAATAKDRSETCVARIPNAGARPILSLKKRAPDTTE